MHLTQPFDQHLGAVTKIGNEAESACARMKGKSYRVDRVMWHGKSLDKNVANGELGTGAKNSPIIMSIQHSFAANCFCRQRIRINRHLELAAEHFQPTDMIAVFVREQD